MELETWFSIFALTVLDSFAILYCMERGIYSASEGSVSVPSSARFRRNRTVSAPTVFGFLAGAFSIAAIAVSIVAIAVSIVSIAGPVFAADFYKVVKEKGVWWLQDPTGAMVLSLGVNGVSPGIPVQDYKPSSPAYCAMRFNASAAQWRESATKRLKDWGFNTFGIGSEGELTASGGMSYLVLLGLGKAVGAPWSDPGSEKAKARYREIMSLVAGFRNDPNLIGYVLDEELGWWDESIFLHTLKRSVSEDPLKGPLLRIVKKAYRGKLKNLLEDIYLKPKPAKFDDLEGKFQRASFRAGRRPLAVEVYIEWLARRYYEATCAAVRKADSNHLIFGDSYGGYYSQPVVRAAAKYVDVISVNYNALTTQGWPSPSYFLTLARLSRKPIIVTECYFAAAENRSGNRNANGRFMTVVSQRERAAGASALCEALVKFPFVVGYHWFQYFDQPPGSSQVAASGEDFNTGLVDIKDREYREVTEALTEINAGAAAIHGMWPGESGLERAPMGLKIGPLAELPIIDGLLDEWPVDRAWLPEVKSAAPFEPFGDVYLAWHPEGLAIAVVYRDYRVKRYSRGGPKADTERLTLGFGMEDNKPVVFTLNGIHMRKDQDDPGSEFHKPEVVAVRGGVPFPADGRFLATQSADEVTHIIEVFLPSALLKRSSLEPGDMIRGTVSLRLRANFKELFWPRPFKLTSFEESSTWASLKLGERAKDEDKRVRPARRAAIHAGGTVSSG